MNSKKFRYVLFPTIALLLFVGGCTNTTANKPGTNKSATLPTPVERDSEIAVENRNKAELVRSSTVTDKERTGSPASETGVDPAKSSKLTDTAKFLAGMKVDDKSAIAAQQNSQTWKEYAAFFDDAWVKLQDQQLSKITRWADTELKSINRAPAPIFYPFSGPDFLYAYHFFPKGTDYILAGLEPVGDIPDIQKISGTKMDTKLQGIQKSLYAILQLSFFRTKAMKEDLADKGVLPILFVFMARTNNRIVDVQYIGLDKEANIQVLDPAQKDSLGKTMIPGVKVSFVPEGESKPRNLYYFSVDLSNSALQKTPEFNKFVQQFPEPITYLKAASYLMHYDDFSIIRDLILSQSTSLLQDDSGMPVKYLDSAKWDLKFYGTYTQPIDLFKGMYQADLRKIYQSDTSIQPLDFGIGYKFQVNESNLMLGVAKDKPQPQTVQ